MVSKFHISKVEYKLVWVSLGPIPTISGNNEYAINVVQNNTTVLDYDDNWNLLMYTLVIPCIPAFKNKPGGGGFLIYPWVGRCGTAPHTLTLFKTNIADFPTLFKTEFRFFNTLFKTFNPNIT